MAVLVGLAACGGDHAIPLDPPTDPSASSGRGPTWADVAPIVGARCSGCHQPGGGAPFALLTHADAAPYAGAMAVAVQGRAMPPWLVVADGSCNTFRDAHWLDQDEIDLVVAWADAGAPEGLPGTSPITPAPALMLDDATHTIDLPEQRPEAEGDFFAPNDEYRCFQVTDLAEQQAFLTGYEVLPGNDAIVHHVIGMIVDPTADSWDRSRTNAEEIARLEAEDPRPGWDCLGSVGGAGREKSIPIDWAPGQGAVRYPDGLGVRLAPHEWIVLQVHYNLADPATEGASDQTTVKLRLDDAVETEAYVGLPDPLLMSLYDFPNVDTLAPGEPETSYTWTLSGQELLAWAYHPQYALVDALEIRAVMPHMHQRGVAQRMEIRRAGGGVDCGFELPRWDFEWQKVYWYEAPIRVGRHDTVTVTCTYDTSGDAAAIWPGWGTNNEMCLTGVIVTVPEAR